MLLHLVYVHAGPGRLRCRLGGQLQLVTNLQRSSMSGLGSLPLGRLPLGPATSSSSGGRASLQKSIMTDGICTHVKTLIPELQPGDWSLFSFRGIVFQIRNTVGEGSILQRLYHGHPHAPQYRRDNPHAIRPWLCYAHPSRSRTARAAAKWWSWTWYV